jgi:hypothetical protein
MNRQRFINNGVGGDMKRRRAAAGVEAVRGGVSVIMSGLVYL